MVHRAIADLSMIVNDCQLRGLRPLRSHCRILFRFVAPFGPPQQLPDGEVSAGRNLLSPAAHRSLRPI